MPKHIIPKNNATLISQRISFEKESPQGDLTQETYRKHPCLVLSILYVTLNMYYYYYYYFYYYYYYYYYLGFKGLRV